MTTTSANQQTALAAYDEAVSARSAYRRTTLLGAALVCAWVGVGMFVILPAQFQGHTLTALLSLAAAMALTAYPAWWISTRTGTRRKAYVRADHVAAVKVADATSSAALADLREEEIEAWLNRIRSYASEWPRQGLFSPPGTLVDSWPGALRSRNTEATLCWRSSSVALRNELTRRARSGA